ncbi:TPA: Kelch motif, variant 3 [Trebouxia sp. C0004]
MLFFPLKVWASYLLLCTALQQPAARASQWETIHETSSNVWGGRRTPPVRFSHAAVVLNDQVVITHGFFYDVEARASQWLSDAWSMSTQSPYTWHKLHNSVEAAAAQTSYSKKVTPAAPCGRYGATAVVYNQQLWLFGGTDGGFSKNQTSNRKSGPNMDEVYMYDPEKHSWTFINGRGKKPIPRYLHSAVVVDNAMLVFGGSEKTAGDVWSFSLKKLSWTRLSHVSLLSHGLWASICPIAPGYLLGLSCNTSLHDASACKCPTAQAWSVVLGSSTYMRKSIIAQGNSAKPGAACVGDICAKAFCWRQYLHLPYTVLEAFTVL